MSVIVNINSVDRTRNVRWKSLRVDNVLTNKSDSCFFDIFYESVNNTYQPVIGQVVEVQDGGVTIFKGPIIEIDEVPTNYLSRVYQVKCSDFTRFFDRKLVVNSYSNMKIQDVIDDIVSTYAPDFTTTNVNCTFTVDQVQFNYEYPSDCLKQLADLAGYDFYIDENKDIHFFHDEISSAPFGLTDTSANWDANSLIIRNDNTQIKNQIYVRGSEYLGSEFTSVIEVTGVDTIYPLGYRYADFGVTLTGQPLNVGIDNVDDEDIYDVMYNFQEKIIRFREARKPTSGSAIRVSGKPYIPVLVKVSDKDAQNSIGTAEGGSGVYETVIIDKTIESKESARDRAEAEIERWKNTIVEAQFTSKTAGLRAGQKINLNITSRGVSADYIISRVVYKMFTPTSFEYDVQLITTKTYGIIEWMMQQIREGRKAIEISPDEVLDVIELVDETMSISESITTGERTLLTEDITYNDTFTSYIDNQPTWVAGPYSPSSLEDRKRPAFADLDCFLGS